MDLIGKVDAGIANFSKVMKNSVDNCKLDGKIVEQEKRIKLLTKEIGTLILARLDSGEEMYPEVMERYIAIVEAKEIISTLEKEKIRTTIICEKCGKKTSVDMNYCGACGTRLKEEPTDN